MITMTIRPNVLINCGGVFVLGLFVGLHKSTSKELRLF